MKTDDDFKPFDEVVDSMAAASGRLGVPLEMIKQLKRAGCDAFRGSRVHLGKLRKALVESAKREPGLSDVLLSIVEVARIVANKLPHEDAEFMSDSGKITETIHNGFACALIVVAPDEVDYFLPKSAALMENAFKSTRKGCRDAINPKSPAMK